MTVMRKIIVLLSLCFWVTSPLLAVEFYIPAAEFTSCVGLSCHRLNPYYNGLVVSCAADEGGVNNPDSEHALTRDPVNVLSGAMIDEVTDLSLPDPIFPMEFSRHYVSGRGWRHSFDIRIEGMPSSRRISLPNGSTVPFTYVTNTIAANMITTGWRTYRDVDWTLNKIGTSYVVNMGNGAKLVFNGSGYLTNMVDSCGNSVVLRLSGTRLISVSSGNRQMFTLTWSDGLLTRVDTPEDDYHAEYSHDEDGNLSSVSVVVGDKISATTYEYGQYGLTRKVDAMGVPTVYSYCDERMSPNLGSAVGIVHGDGWWEHSVSYGTNRWNGGVGWNARVSYNRGNEAGRVVHEYASDTERVRVDAVRISGMSSIGVSNECLTTYSVDTNYRPIREVEREISLSSGIASTATVERTLSYAGVAAAAITKETLSFNGVTALMSREWDSSYLNVIAERNEFGGMRRYSYTTNGLVSSTWLSDGGTGISEKLYVGRNPKGLITSITDASGGILEICRDSEGWAKFVTLPDGVVLMLERNTLGYVVAVIRSGIELMRRTVDADGRVTKVEYPDGTSEEMGYDECRRLVEIVDREGTIHKISYAAGSVATNATLHIVETDATENRVSLGIPCDRQLNANEVRWPNCASVESYALDAMGRVAEVTNAVGQVMRVTYAVGNLPSHIDCFDGIAVDFSWDAYGLRSISYPSFTNEYGRLMNGTLTRASGLMGEIGFSYDKFGHLTNSISPYGNVARAYDAAGNVAAVTFDGGGAEIERDVAGRITNMTWTVGSAGLPFTFVYSSHNGELASVDFPNNTGRRISYDVMDRVSRIESFGHAGSQETSCSFTYDSRDYVVAMLTDDGRAAEWSYDGLGRLVSEETLSPSGTVDRAYAYAYDERGNMVVHAAINEDDSEEVVESIFSDDNRLVTWSRNCSTLTDGIVTNAVYAFADSGCTTSVTYRLYGGGERRVVYEWTDDRRLSAVSIDGVEIAHNAYDALGRLMSVSCTEGNFNILEDDGHVLADVSDDGTPLRVYMREPDVDEWLGFVDLTSGSPIPYFFVTDRLGSVVAVTDADGSVVERYEYDAWGRVLSVVGENDEVLERSAVGNRILWHGREYFWDVGLYYFRNRWYAPDIRRWLSKDPIGIFGGLNLYRFCEDNPVNYEDHDGLGKVAILAKTTKNGWKYISKAAAIRLLKEKGTIAMIGRGATGKARRLLKSVTSKKVVVHDGHKPGQKPHVQEKNGGGTHILLFGAKITCALPFGELLDFFNPISDIQDLLNFVIDFIDEYKTQEIMDEERNCK